MERMNKEEENDGDYVASPVGNFNWNVRAFN